MNIAHTRPRRNPHTRGLDRRIIPDTKHPGMYRVRLPGGGLSDMLSLTWAKDALTWLAASTRRRAAP
jgi:hypothetical protein